MTLAAGRARSTASGGERSERSSIGSQSWGREPWGPLGSEQASGRATLVCSQKDYGIFFCLFAHIVSIYKGPSICIPYPFLDVVTTTRERVVEAAAAFETRTSDTSLLTRPAGNHQQTVIPASNPGVRRRSKRICAVRGRHTRPREKKIQVPRCKSPLN